jgi:hypothetical protein
VKSAAKSFVDISSAVLRFSQAHPEAFNGFVKAVAAFGALRVAKNVTSILGTVIKLPYLEAKTAVLALRGAWIAADGSLLTMIKNTKIGKAVTLAYAAVTKAVAMASKAWAAVQGVLNAALTANPIGLVVMAVAGLVAAFVIAYKKVDWFREKVDGAMAAIKAIFLSGFEKIMAVMNKAGEIWDKFKSALGIAPKIPVPELKAASVAGSMPPIAAHAAGGVFDRPHLGLVAESGVTESIIPHSPDGERIWQTTGEMAGFSMQGAGGDVFSITANLTVNAQPGADGDEIGRQALKALERELPRLLRRCEEQRLRVAY